MPSSSYTIREFESTSMIFNTMEYKNEAAKLLGKQILQGSEKEVARRLRAKIVATYDSAPDSTSDDKSKTLEINGSQITVVVKKTKAAQPIIQIRSTQENYDNLFDCYKEEAKLLKEEQQQVGVETPDTTTHADRAVQSRSGRDGGRNGP